MGFREQFWFRNRISEPRSTMDGNVPEIENSDTRRVMIIPGTVREDRSSIHPARYVAGRFRDRDLDVELFDMRERRIPLMESMRSIDDPTPPDVEAFGQSIEATDLIVLVTPEYNHSIPGALKNLLDYLYEEYDGKPFAYITVSSGPYGGVRALNHLNDVVLELGGRPGPDLPVANVREVFDADGTLADEAYEDRFDGFVDDALEHARAIA